MTALAKSENREVGRSPAQLVPLIKSALSAAERSYQEVADLLAEARPSFGVYAEFLSWAHRHFGFKETQARAYLNVGKYEQNNRGATRQTSLAEALRVSGHSNKPTSGAVRRDWQPEVDALAERARREQDRIARAAEDELTRRQEREAQRELSLRIIDIGWKVLAKELHPDKGGSRDMMARLNRARDHLKQMA